MPNRFLILLLCTALVLLDVLLFAVGSSPPFRIDATVFVLYGLLFGQFSLLSIWCALGRSHGMLRILSAATGLTLLTLALNFLHHNGWLWLLLLAVQGAIIAGPLTVTRWRWGLRLDMPAQVGAAAGNSDPPVNHRDLLGEGVSRPSPAEQSPTPPDEPDLRPVQFTLLHLMLAMTVIAVLLGAVRAAGFLAPEMFSRFRLQTLMELTLIAAAFAAVGLAAAWAGLGRGQTALRVGVFSAVAIAVFLGLRVMFAGPDSILGVISAIQGVELAAALGTLRVAGFRLVRRA